MQVLGNSYALLWYYLCLVLGWEQEGFGGQRGNATVFWTDTAVLILSGYNRHGLNPCPRGFNGLK